MADADGEGADSPNSGDTYPPNVADTEIGDESVRGVWVDEGAQI